MDVWVKSEIDQLWRRIPAEKVKEVSPGYVDGFESSKKTKEFVDEVESKTEQSKTELRRENHRLVGNSKKETKEFCWEVEKEDERDCIENKITCGNISCYCNYKLGTICFTISNNSYRRSENESQNYELYNNILYC